ncbi:SDR family oxidoreductase [Streptomyces cyanogenus]|uniref:Pentachlorophenol 4-monooxygenase n=1 Tax=Streptomyces cyanogenus TaxID=80860 RepID=A0ABX7TXT6_STRCY|nr:SDR family oxidoreductase [Streptomyces cyanogenus]QTE01576.1 Pentachlorophenol 4-monooxygenase [Streptomyces cyanogenus]
MAAKHTDTQVIVVGAGPVGLMLAGELRLGGADVVVVEKLSTPTTESRASTLHARTMEILDSRGLLDELVPVPNDVMGHFGGIPLDLTLPSAYPGQWKVPQTRVEELLQGWATGLGAVVLRGHELRGLTVGQGHVAVDVLGPDGPVRMRGRYVVGCDGEQSAVRRLSGIAFPGEDASRELIRADVAGIDIPPRRFQRLESGLAIAARRPDGVTRVMVHEFGRTAEPRSAEPEFSEVAEIWKRVTGEDISGGEPLWVNAFGNASRLAERYRDGRVLLAGDAAHQQMPVGGQALNLGLQDAVNLGWKLAAQVTGRQPDGLLDSYHTERHAVGRRTLSNIRAQSLLLLGGGEVEGVRGVFAEITAMEDVRTRLAGMISGLESRYEVGPGHHPLLGARLPHVELAGEQGTVTTTALLRPGRAVLIGLSGDPLRGARLRAAATPWFPRVTVTLAEPVDHSAPLADVDAVLARPDGHVVWTGSAGEAELHAVLRRWFGEPEPAGTAGTRFRAHGSSTRGGGLAGRTALVTHAGGGAGRAAAMRLAAAGALVAIHHTGDEQAADDVVRAIGEGGGCAFALGAELGGYGNVQRLFADLEAELTDRTGRADLDILVNSADDVDGVAPEHATPEEFDRLVAAGAKAPYFVIQRALRSLADGGRVINISRGAVEPVEPKAVAYAMAKGAVETLARHYAVALAPRGITVNSVAPGTTDDGERVGTVVAFLAGDDAGGITGAVFDADGSPVHGRPAG